MGIAGHTQTLHKGEGAPVNDGGVGDDLGKTQPTETVIDDRPRRFQGITPPPIAAGEPPGDHDGRE
jgi:hypothetical protein